MNITTPRRFSYYWDRFFELMSSMRFAISLLVLVAVASIVGTVLTQNAAQASYIDQFGSFWAMLFAHLGLYTVYSAWWFLLILFFLVGSTSLCLVRNTPKIIIDLRRWNAQIQEGGLRALHHHRVFVSPQSRTHVVPLLIKELTQYRLRIVRKSTGDLIIGRMGAANKLGYIFAHGAIVMICLGALLDSDFFMHAQLWWGDKKPMASQEQNLLLADIPAQSRLAQSNPSFRASLFVPEGKNTAAAVLTTREGILVQDLPFTLQLNQFVVEYYSTGMPKSFVSEVVLTDRQTGEQMPAKIAVNHPLIYKGIAIYQSSFEDGGSQLDFTAYPLIGAQRAPFKLSAEVGGQRQIKSADGPLMAEFTDFRAINVENIMDAAGREDVRGVVSRVSQLQAHLGAATKSSAHTLRNMGPSVHYKLRDASGQAREFHNYMLPVMLDGVQVLLAGVRSSPGDAFQYLRIPVDEQGTPQEWLHLHAALADPNMRAQAAKRYAKHFPNEASSRGLMRAQLEASALRMLALFAGGDTDDKAFPVRGGFSAIAQLIDQRVPLADQERSVEILMQVLNGSLIELWQLVRAKNGLPPAGDLPEQRAFMGVAMNALSDSFLYAAPMLLQLDNFREVKASVFQVTRTPGKYIVYLGCLFLVIGVFSMFYIRERQLWVWVKDHGGTGSEIVMACLAHRKTIDFDNEFADLHMRLAQVAQATLRTE